MNFLGNGLLLSFLQFLLFDFESTMGVDPPYIRTECSLGESFDRAFCIDVFGFLPTNIDWNLMIAHTCKPGNGFDLLWAFGDNPYNTFDSGSTNIGQVWGTSDLLADYCLAAYCDESECGTRGELCKNTTALTVWEYFPDDKQLKLYGSIEDYNDDSFSSSDSDSDSSSDEDDRLCLRAGVSTIVQDNTNTFNIKDLFIQTCQDIIDANELKFSQWIIFEDDDVDQGPDTTC